MIATRRRRLTWMTVLIAVLAALVGMTMPAVAKAAGTGSSTAAAPPGPGPLQPMPTLPANICRSSALPTDYGTNFPTPGDPNGFGFANQTAIGWEGNYYAPFEYLSGSYFARRRARHLSAGGQGPVLLRRDVLVRRLHLWPGGGPGAAAGSVQWNEADGYLPAMTTSMFAIHAGATWAVEYAPSGAFVHPPRPWTIAKETKPTRGIGSAWARAFAALPDENLAWSADPRGTARPGLGPVRPGGHAPLCRR